MRRTAVTAALCFAAACGTDPAVAPTETLMPAGDGLAAVATCNLSNPRHDAARRPWVCGEQVQVTSTVQEIRDAIVGAIAVWNSVLGHDGLPKLVTTAPTHGNKVTVRYVGSSPGSGTIYYCGVNMGAEIQVYRSASQTSCGVGGGYNASTSLSTLLAHELAHSVGIDHLSTKLSFKPLLNHCVSSLRQDLGLNGSLCQAERQVIRYNYGLRPDHVNIEVPFLTVSGIVGAHSVDSGLTTTLTADVAAELGSTPSGVGFAWGSSDNDVATVNASGTVTGRNPGPTTITATLNDSRYEAVNFEGKSIQFTVIPGPPPPPIGLNVTGITYNSATVRWTNATDDVSTIVQYRVAPAGPWLEAPETAVDATSRTISGLEDDAPYEVKAKHVRLTKHGPFTTPLVSFRTAMLPPPTITNFRVTRCVQQMSNGKVYNNFTMGWNASPTQKIGSYQIGSYHTNNATSAAVIATVSFSQTSATVGGYLSGTVTVNRYFWVRYVDVVSKPIRVTAWVPLNPNPLATNYCGA